MINKILFIIPHLFGIAATLFMFVLCPYIMYLGMKEDVRINSLPEKQYCEQKYSDATIDSISVKCLKYFNLPTK